MRFFKRKGSEFLLSSFEHQIRFLPMNPKEREELIKAHRKGLGLIKEKDPIQVKPK